MQVFAKCNQNCVKIAGNPRDSRRFRVCPLPSISTRLSRIVAWVFFCCFFGSTFACSKVLLMRGYIKCFTVTINAFIITRDNTVTYMFSLIPCCGQLGL